MNSRQSSLKASAGRSNDEHVPTLSIVVGRRHNHSVGTDGASSVVHVRVTNESNLGCLYSGSGSESRILLSARGNAVT
jgi:hypothetical protein